LLGVWQYFLIQHYLLRPSFKLGLSFLLLFNTSKRKKTGIKFETRSRLLAHKVGCSYHFLIFLFTKKKFVQLKSLHNSKTLSGEVTSSHHRSHLPLYFHLFEHFLSVSSPSSNLLRLSSTPSTSLCYHCLIIVDDNSQTSAPLATTLMAFPPLSLTITHRPSWLFHPFHDQGFFLFFYFNHLFG
jgi:hypothetical protein